jgi:hypothetical protein
LVPFTSDRKLMPHPCIPSPARVAGIKLQIIMAGEGSKKERGVKPPLIKLSRFQTELTSSVRDRAVYSNSCATRIT